MAEVTARGVRFHYQRMGPEGAARRVVFLHGLVMDNLSSWYFSVAPAVAEEADVLLIDLRGHGRSERPATGYTLRDMVTDVEEIVREVLGPSPVTVVGNSFGALLALELTRTAPALVEKLILVDGHLGTAGFGERMSKTLSLKGEEADKAIAASFQNWLGRHSSRKRTRLADHARALIEQTSLVRDLESTPALTAADVAAVVCPVLALYGSESDVLQESRPLLLALPKGTLRIFPGCSHSLLWEATDELRAAIVAACRGGAESAEGP